MSKYNFLTITDVTYDGNIIWCYDAYFDALLRLDMQSGEMALEAVLDCRNSAGIYAKYAKIEYHKNKIIFIPYNTDKILIYDILSKKSQELEFNLDGWKKENIYELFFTSAIYEDYIYFFPMRYTSILRIDLKTLHITYISEWNKDVKRNYMYFGASDIKGNITYLPLWGQNTVMRFDLSTEKYDFIKIGDKKTEIADIHFDGDDVWISALNRSFAALWSMDENKFKLCADMPKNFKDSYGIFYLVIGFDYLYTVPLHGNMIVKINKHTGKTEDIENLPSFQPNRNIENALNRNIYFCKKITDDLVFAYSFFAQEFIVWDLSNDTVRKIKAKLKNIDDINIFKTNILSKIESVYGIAAENNELTLDLYLKALKNDYQNKDIISENIGEKIWNKISGEFFKGF